MHHDPRPSEEAIYSQKWGSYQNRQGGLAVDGTRAYGQPCCDAEDGSASLLFAWETGPCLLECHHRPSPPGYHKSFLRSWMSSPSPRGPSSWFRRTRWSTASTDSKTSQVNVARLPPLQRPRPGLKLSRMCRAAVGSEQPKQGRGGASRPRGPAACAAEQSDEHSTCRRGISTQPLARAPPRDRRTQRGKGWVAVPAPHPAWGFLSWAGARRCCGGVSWRRWSRPAVPTGEDHPCSEKRRRRHGGLGMRGFPSHS